MTSKALGNLIRFSALTTAICGLFLCIYVIPSIGKSIVISNPKLDTWFWPWLVFAWLLSVPCFAILVLIWKVSGTIINETVFTMQTAKWIKTGAILLLSDSAFWLIGNFVLGMYNMSSPSVLLFVIMGAIFSVGLATLAGVLSRYLTKAALLQEESEGTL